MLTAHLLNHERTSKVHAENQVEGLETHLQRDAGFTSRIITQAGRRGLCEEANCLLILTHAGRERAKSAIA